MTELSRRTENIFLGLAAALLAFRFLWLGDAPFAVDEPMFQMLVEDTILAGNFVAKSLGGSSLQVPYGATALWLYAIPHLISKNYISFVVFHTLVFTLGSYFFYLGMKLWMGRSVAALALLFSATSPFMFFYARHPWDNTFIATMSSATFYLIASLLHCGYEKRAMLWRVLGLAIICTMGLNLHLMSGPLLLGMSLFLVWHLLVSPISWRQRWELVFVYGFVILFISAPYLARVYRDVTTLGPVDVPAAKNKAWGDLRNLWWIILRSQIFSSVWNVKNFVEPVDNYYFEFTGRLYERVFRADWLGWVPKAMSLVFLFFPILHLWNRRAKLDPLHIYCTFIFVVTLIVYQYLNVPTAPHYFQGVCWLVFAGSSIVYFWVKPKWARIFLGVVFGGVMLMNTSFLISSTIFIHENTGTRGMNHGTAIKELHGVTMRLCDFARQNGMQKLHVNLSRVFVTDIPLRYFSRNSEECRGIELDISRIVTNAPLVYLDYPKDSPTKANLEIIDPAKNP